MVDTPPPSFPKRNHIWTIIAIVLLGAGLFMLGRLTLGPPKSKPASKAVPVLAAQARKGDIDVTTTALGTVTPLSTVTIKTQVTGRLISVNYNEGQKVKKDSVLAEIDPRPFAAALLQAQGQLERDKAQLAGAKIDLARYQDAYTRNAVPKQQLDDQIALVQQYEGAVKLDQGSVDNAAVQLGYCHITSPVNGRVGLRLVDPGNVVQITDATGLLVIAQTQPTTVIFSVAEDVLPSIQEQLKKSNKMQVIVYDRDQSKKIATGELEAVDNEIDPTTGTVKLRAQFANDDDALFPNQFVNATLLIQTLHDQTLIPAAAVQRNGDEAFVYVLNPDQTVSMRKVSAGISNGTVVAVAGIEPGDTVVTDGFDKLQDGSKVEVGSPGNNSQASAPEKPSKSGVRKANTKG